LENLSYDIRKYSKLLEKLRIYLCFLKYTADRYLNSFDNLQVEFTRFAVSLFNYSRKISSGQLVSTHSQ